jgi:hypothetical protein
LQNSSKTARRSPSLGSSFHLRGQQHTAQHSVSETMHHAAPQPLP